MTCKKELQGTITVKYKGKEYNLVPSTSLLQDLRACGIPVPSGCLQGICGVCKITLIKGEIHYNGIPLAYVSDQEVLTCIARARTDLEIETD
jgi:ferredoxin